MAYVNNDYLAKMGWRILSNKTNLWPNLMPQKFLHNTYFFEYRSKSNECYIWKVILQTRDLLRKSIH